MNMPGAFVEAVSRTLRSDLLHLGEPERTDYASDWTRVHTPNAAGVAFPHTTDEVAKLLSLCDAHRVCVVPSGGRTGLAGGAVAAQGELVISMERMRHLGNVDPVARTLRVQAGAVTQSVHAHCAPFGLTWPVNFASSGSSHIGGNIATNAGGIRVVRYGPTRAWILGLQVVTMQGHVLELNGFLEKNNTGFDLRQLFIGSEGTLGIVTEATLKLAPIPAASQVALFAVDDVDAALRLFAAARRDTHLQLLAFEYFSSACLDVVLAERNLPAPLQKGANAYVLLEIEGSNDASVRRQCEAFCAESFAADLIRDGVLSQSRKDAAALWQLREGISESLGRRGLLHKNDVAVPVANIGAFAHDVEEVFRRDYAPFSVYVFGHLGDGNLHINVLKPPSMAKDAFLAATRQTDTALFTLIRKHQGAVSAEHGIGLLKKHALPYTRTAEEIALFRAIKGAFDPQGLMNPGKLVDP